MKKVNVAILGFGIVGSKVYEIIQENRNTWRKQYQIEVQVVQVLVKNKKKKRSVMIDSSLLTENPSDLVNRLDVDLCFECMGGGSCDSTKEYILQLLEQKKDVIMSSKKCLALYGDEILKTARKNGRTVRFEATVGGGIPIIQSIQNSSYGEQIQKIYGVLNATSNYILSKMILEGMSYEAALNAAKEAGYAENDPSEDVEGMDAAYKLMLLVKEAMGREVSMEQFRRVSIENVTPEMIVEAKQQHEVFKQVAYARITKDGKVDVSVEPQRISEQSILNCAAENNNIICTEGTRTGMRAYFGQGAGANPTASVMIDDLLAIIK